MTSWIVLDWESASAADLKTVGAARYWEDPTTYPLCLSYETERGTKGTWYPGQPCPPAILYAIENGWTFVAHNVVFEKYGWLFYAVPILCWPPIPADRWHDTGAVCSMRGIPFSLEKALPALDIAVSKDMEGNKLTLSMSKLDRKTGMYPVLTQEKHLRIGAYCERDIEGQTALHRRMGWLPPAEREIWLASNLVNDRGIRLDLDFIDAAQSIVDQATGPLAEEFRQITGGLNFTQGAKIIAWCGKQGVRIPDMTKDTLARLLGETEEDEDDDNSEIIEIALPDNVRRALHIRQLVGSASIKKLKRMRQCVNFDGRARNLLQYHGTTPGRQAGRLFQPHNFPRGTIKVGGKPPDPQGVVDAIMTRDPAYVEMLYGPAVEVVVSSLRHAMIADPDRVFVSGDYTGIQLRVLLALAGQHDKTALLASGVNAYCDMGQQIYGREIDKHNDIQEYTIAKNAVLGLGFGMGAPKFHRKYAEGQDLSFTEGVVHVYRKEWAPMVPALWYELNDAAMTALTDGVPEESHGILYRREDRWLTAEMPGGNKLWYPDPEVGMEEMPWSTPEEPDFRLGWTFVATKMGKRQRVKAFGGLLAENACMAVERQIVEDAKARCEANGYPVVLEVHDEILTEPLSAHADKKELQQILEDVKPWVKEIKVPIAVDCWSGQCYMKG